MNATRRRSNCYLFRGGGYEETKVLKFIYKIFLTEEGPVVAT